jgi:hypothetical protein
LSTLPYDTAANEYRLSTGDFKFSFPKVKVFNVVLKVNKDRYFVYPEKDKCGITYLNRKTENILVDFSVADAKGRLTFYKNQPIEAFPYDEMSGCRIIDKNLLKVLKEKGAVAGR